MGTKFLRLLGALFAVALVASACGGETETVAADTIEEAIVSEDNTPETTEDEEVEAIEEEVLEPVEDEGTEAIDEEASHDDEGSHSHDNVLEVNADGPIPEVTIELAESDEPGVFDLVVSLTNFTITEENLDGEPIDNEGHLHLYLDGRRVERFFGLNHQVSVPEGEHLVEVELSANDHSPYAIEGVPIRAAANVIGEGANVEPESDLSVAAVFAAGAVTLDADERIEASVGDVVTLSIDSDVIEEIHLHGYDIFADVLPGETTTVTFTADTPGRFEIEFETSHAFIAELVVS